VKAGLTLRVLCCVLGILNVGRTIITSHAGGDGYA